MTVDESALLGDDTGTYGTATPSAVDNQPGAGSANPLQYDAASEHMLEPEDFSKLRKNTSSASALMNFIKGNIGTGILALPVAFKYSGLWMGLFLLLFYGCLSSYLMHVLLRTADSVIMRHELDRSTMDYTETVFIVFKYGPQSLRKYKGKFKHLVNGFLLLTQVGFCCIYILFISENIEYFIRVVAPNHDANIFLIGFIVTLALLPLSQITNMRVFAAMSAVAIGVTVVGIVLIFSYLLSTGLMDPYTLPWYKPFGETLISLGIFIFTFEGISLTLPIRNRMINPHKFVLPFGVLNMAMVIVISLCALLGFFGYLRFGEDTLSSITYNIPNSPVAYALVKPLFIFAIFTSYMLQFFVPASIFSRLMMKLRCHREATPRRQSINRRVMRVCLVLFTYIIAMAVPHLDLMVSLLGAVSSSMLALIIPPLLEMVHLWPDRDTIPRFWLTVVLKHTVLTLIGIFSLFSGTLATIIQISRTLAPSD
nr:unnamed protein product [Spirometra erinaceieuropaei]